MTWRPKTDQPGSSPGSNVSVPPFYIDEVNYLSYDARYADLLLKGITRRFQQRATVLTTNKLFSEWNQVFPYTSRVETLVDRLMHSAEILAINGDSYRFNEAQEAAAAKALQLPNARNGSLGTIHDECRWPKDT